MKFLCTFCNKASSASEWNKVTNEVYGDKIVKIGRKKDSFHICPACCKQSHSDNIRRVTNA